MVADDAVKGPFMWLGTVLANVGQDMLDFAVRVSPEGAKRLGSEGGSTLGAGARPGGGGLRTATHSGGSARVCSRRRGESGETTVGDDGRG